MSMDASRRALESLIADTQNRVLALSGPWGTGKSHLWDEVRRHSGDANVKKSVYVSLFRRHRHVDAEDQAVAKLLARRRVQRDAHGRGQGDPVGPAGKC